MKNKKTKNKLHEQINENDCSSLCDEHDSSTQFCSGKEFANFSSFLFEYWYQGQSKIFGHRQKLVSSGNVSWYLTKTDKYFHLIFQVKTPKKETKPIFLRVKNAEKTVAIINSGCSLTTNTAMRLSLSEKVSVKKITFDGKIIEIEIE